MTRIYTELDFVGTKDAIEAEISDLLGTYTFPPNNNQVVPAISIDISNNYPPPGTTPAGLEVVLRPLADASMQTGIGKNRFWTVETQIAFKQWDVNGNVIEAVDRVLNCVDLGITFDVGAREVRDEDRGNIELQTITYTQQISCRAVS